MKTVLLAIVYLVVSSPAFSASTDINVRLNSLIDKTSEENVLKIIDARSRLIAAGSGLYIRKNCYKEYVPDFPRSPKTVPFLVEENLPVEVTRNHFQLIDALGKARKLSDMLNEKLKSGCIIKIKLTAMIEGETVAGDRFRSTIEFHIDKNKITAVSGTLKQNMRGGIAKSLDIQASKMAEEAWESTWKNYDPEMDQTVTNY